MTAAEAAFDAATDRSRRAERRHRLMQLLMLAPALLLLLTLFIYPLIGMAWQSIYANGLTLEQYRQIVATDVYLEVIGLTFRVAAAVTAICLIVGYPVAYVLNFASLRMQRVLLIVVVLPYFTSLIVRTYAWMVLLGNNGIINQWLKALGLTTEPVPMLYNEFGVLIGMTYVLLPFMVMTLYSVMKGIDRGLLRAAYVLGAGPGYAFRRVFLPLSLPGLAGGVLLVFILALGFFITPALMGGPSDLMIAMLIEREVEFTMNWAFASALSMVLLAITLIAFAVYNRFTRLDRMFEARA